MNLAELLPKIKDLPAEEQMKLLRMINDLEEAKDREKAQTNFLTFVKKMWPGFIGGRHHEIIGEAFERVLDSKCNRLIINLGPRHPLQVDTEVPTPDGFKTIASLEVGDTVFGVDGKPVKVVGKSPVYHRQLYEVTTIDGHVIRCDGEHLWTTRFHGYGFRDFSTDQLYKRQNGEPWLPNLDGSMSMRLGGKGIRPPLLPVAGAVECPERDFPVDPYVLGYWLGNGSAADSTITCNVTDIDFLRREFDRRGHVTSDRNTRGTFGVLGLKVKLRDELGILNDKRIPIEYMSGSISQRMALLQGLMDSDGNVSKKGQCFWSQSDLPLIKQTEELLNSLGIKNFTSENRAIFNGRDYGPCWRITFYKKDCCLLLRKAERTFDPSELKNGARSVTFRKLDEWSDVQCIKIDNEDGLFLVGRGYVPSHNTKSEFASFLLPAWFMGRFPDKKIVQATHTAELAVGFGRKVRNLLSSDIYQNVFPGVELRADNKAAGRWATNKGGEYFAVGVGGALAGKGADLFICDDPHNEQEALAAASDPSVYDKVYSWWTSGPRQRLQPNGKMILVMTRWGVRDLSGQLIQAGIDRGMGDEWEVIELPAIMPSGEPLWPEFWPRSELEALKAELPQHKWLAQYQQQPTNEEGAILKREDWRIWTKKNPPDCEIIMIAADTAYTRNTRSDYSAFSVWGVFQLEDENGAKAANLILLDYWKDRLEFPALKAKAAEMNKTWNPDIFIVEGKASGLPLVSELRSVGIPVSVYTPTRATGDKITRANSISDIFRSKMVWMPEKPWADELREECAAFPNGSTDDGVDTVIMALMRFRSGGMIRLPSDYEDDEEVHVPAEPYY